MLNALNAAGSLGTSLPVSGSLGLNLPVSGGVDKAAPTADKAQPGGSAQIPALNQVLGNEHKAAGPQTLGLGSLAPRGSVGEPVAAKAGAADLNDLINQQQQKSDSQKTKTYWDNSPYPIIDQEDLLRADQERTRQEEIRKNPPSKAVPA